MLILSTYRVVLHPSYLQKVFSFIIFIKKRYSFTIRSENSRAPRGAQWAELKSDEHLSADCQQNTDIWCVSLKGVIGCKIHFTLYNFLIDTAVLP